MKHCFSICLKSFTGKSIGNIDAFLFQHDAQMDYSGTKLATCSSDRSVKIFSVGNQQSLIANLTG